MDIKKAAVAGTLESSDAMVTIEPNENGIEFELESSNKPVRAQHQKVGFRDT